MIIARNQKYRKGEQAMHLTPEIEKQLEAAVIEWRKRYAPCRRSESELVILIMGARIGYELAANQGGKMNSRNHKILTWVALVLCAVALFSTAFLCATYYRLGMLTHFRLCYLVLFASASAFYVTRLARGIFTGESK